VAPSSGRGNDPTERRLKPKRGRKPSSARWLARQISDLYVTAARDEGYRSRAAFKLSELDDRFRFLKQGGLVVDLGAAPGGWTQVAIERVGRGRVVAVDINQMAPLDGAIVLELDAMAATAGADIVAAAGGRADAVLSDMAPAATGHRATDHLRVVALCEVAHEVAQSILAPGGAFVVKVYQGGAEAELLARLKRSFDSVRHAKPPASRRESAETYLVALGFRGSPPPPAL
jgi:23S rRNA (uridine2552-2'-O)-methyltransferase